MEYPVTYRLKFKNYIFYICVHPDETFAKFKQFVYHYTGVKPFRQLYLSLPESVNERDESYIMRELNLTSLTTLEVLDIFSPPGISIQGSAITFDTELFDAKIKKASVISTTLTNTATTWEENYKTRIGIEPPMLDIPLPTGFAKVVPRMPSHLNPIIPRQLSYAEALTNKNKKALVSVKPPFQCTKTLTTMVPVSKQYNQKSVLTTNQSFSGNKSTYHYKMFESRETLLAMIGEPIVSDTKNQLITSRMQTESSDEIRQFSNQPFSSDMKTVSSTGILRKGQKIYEQLTIYEKMISSVRIHSLPNLEPPLETKPTYTRKPRDYANQLSTGAIKKEFVGSVKMQSKPSSMEQFNEKPPYLNMLPSTGAIKKKLGKDAELKGSAVLPKLNKEFSDKTKNTGATKKRFYKTKSKNLKTETVAKSVILPDNQPRKGDFQPRKNKEKSGQFNSQPHTGIFKHRLGPDKQLRSLEIVPITVSSNDKILLLPDNQLSTEIIKKEVTTDERLKDSKMESTLCNQLHTSAILKDNAKPKSLELKPTTETNKSLGSQVKTYISSPTLPSDNKPQAGEVPSTSKSEYSSDLESSDNVQLPESGNNVPVKKFRRYKSIKKKSKKSTAEPQPTSFVVDHSQHIAIVCLTAYIMMFIILLLINQ